MLDELLWVLRTGDPWRDLPEKNPPYQTYHRRFQQWSAENYLGFVLLACIRYVTKIFMRYAVDVSEFHR